MSLIPHDRMQTAFFSWFYRPNPTSLAGAIATLLTPLLALPAFAQTPVSSESQSQANLFPKSQLLVNAPPLPEEQTAPSGRRDGGASRGNCVDYENLTALVPLIGNTVWGYTTSTHPTFWFYSPAPVYRETPLEFVLQDEEDNALDYVTFQENVDGGIYSYTLSDFTPELPLNTPRYWTFSLYCDPDQPAAFVYLRGTVERIEVPGLEPFSAETERTLDNALRYASVDALHDALTIVAELRRENPNDASIEAFWYELLWQMDLEPLAPEPIQDCCS